jgi:hypothetical protein
MMPDKVNEMPKATTLTLLLILIAASMAAHGQPDPWSRQINQAWWHQANNIEALELSTETSKRMDDHARAFLQEYSASRNQQINNQREFLKHAGRGEWDEARELIEKVAESTAKHARGNRLLKISILQELSEQQRQVLVENFPALINQTWIRIPRQSMLRGANRKSAPVKVEG